MSYQMSGQLQLCATCAYWMGSRTPNYYATHVVLEDQCVKGKCWCLNAPFARAHRYSNTTVCHYYKKWELLK